MTRTSASFTPVPPVATTTESAAGKMWEPVSRRGSVARRGKC